MLGCEGQFMSYGTLLGLRVCHTCWEKEESRTGNPSSRTVYCPPRPNRDLLPPRTSALRYPLSWRIPVSGSYFEPDSLLLILSSTLLAYNTSNSRCSSTSRLRMSGFRGDTTPVALVSSRSSSSFVFLHSSSTHYNAHTTFSDRPKPLFRGSHG